MQCVTSVSFFMPEVYTRYRRFWNRTDAATDAAAISDIDRRKLRRGTLKRPGFGDVFLSPQESAGEVGR